MADKDGNQCGHALCSCAVQEDADYCSPNCQTASASDTTSIACECGHAGCAAELAQKV